MKSMKKSNNENNILQKRTYENLEYTLDEGEKVQQLIEKEYVYNDTQLDYENIRCFDTRALIRNFEKKKKAENELDDLKKKFMKADEERTQLACQCAEKDIQNEKMHEEIQALKALIPDKNNEKEKHKCSVCMEIIENCVSLFPCQHKFCGFCITKEVERKVFRCPLCRREFWFATKDFLMNQLALDFTKKNPDERIPEAEREERMREDKFKTAGVIFVQEDINIYRQKPSYETFFSIN